MLAVKPIASTSRVAQAAHNNAVWCDTVCRVHGVPGEFRDAIWFNRQETPPFYPNVVTLAGEREPQRQLAAQLAAIRAVRQAAVPAAFGVKDSFAALDLAEDRFRVLFGAQWLWRAPARPLPAAGPDAVRWEPLATPAGLAAWEAAWAGGGAERAPRLFLDSLLTVDGVAVLAATRAGQIIAGAIANRSGEVVGISNLFTPEHGAAGLLAGCLRLVHDLFPGLPLVGYEKDSGLRQARQLGFEAVGPLRVWIDGGD